MRAAVLGSPISHSLSPVLHRAAYAELGLDWTYEAIEVAPQTLAGFLDSCDQTWAGLSLTMPLKETVLPLLTEVSALAATTRSANTVVFTDGGRQGFNTDVAGICWALARAGVRDLAAHTVAVIGAGATARSAVAALARVGAADISIVARRTEAFEQMADTADASRVNIHFTPWEHGEQVLLSDLVISTVPVGVADVFAAAVPNGCGVLLDVVYAPWPTAIARAWLDGGGNAIGGLDMLVGQAAEQVRLMTGLEPPVDAMLAAGRAAL